MSLSSQIAINAAGQWGVTALSCVLGLLLVPFLLARLGRDGYGLIAVVMAITAVCVLADLGISGALSRHLAEALAKNDESGFGQFVSTAASINLLVGLAVAAAVVVFAAPMARLFAIPASLHGTGIFLLRSYGATQALLTLCMPVPKAVLASHNRFDMVSLLDALRQLMQSASFFVVLGLTDSGLVGWSIVSVFVGVLALILLWLAVFRVHRGLCLRISGIRASRLKELYRLGSQFTLMTVSSQLSDNANPFILTALLGPGSLSLYRPPSQIMGLFAPVVQTLGNQMHPLATKAHIQSNRSDSVKILFLGTKYTMLVGSVFCAITLSLSGPLCKVWLGPVLGEGYRVCAAVLAVQSVSYLALFAGGTQWAVLLGMKRTKFAAWGRLLFAVVNLSASYMLVRYTKLGVLGVVIPTLAIEIIWRPMLVLHVCRAVGLPVREYLREAYQTPLLIGGAVAATGLVVCWTAPPDHLWSLAASAAAMALVAAVFVWFRGFNQIDRKIIRGAVSRHELGTAAMAETSVR